MRGGSFGAFPFFIVMEQEIWKPIKKLIRFNKRHEIVKEIFLDDGYYVSNRGRIMLSNGEISRMKPNHKGYTTIQFRKEKFKLQQIIMQIFHPEGIRNGVSVDHIDRNPRNNHLDNLRWASDSLQNCNRKVNFKCKKVKCVENGVVYSSCQEAEDSLGLVRNTVSRVARGKRKSIHGYHFIFVDC